VFIIAYIVLKKVPKKARTKSALGLFCTGGKHRGHSKNVPPLAIRLHARHFVKKGREMLLWQDYCEGGGDCCYTSHDILTKRRRSLEEHKIFK